MEKSCPGDGRPACWGDNARFDEKIHFLSFETLADIFHFRWNEMSSKMSLSTWAEGPPFPDAQTWRKRLSVFFCEVQAPGKFKISSQAAKSLLWVFCCLAVNFFLSEGTCKGLETGGKWVKRKDFCIPAGRSSLKALALLLQLNSASTWAFICHREPLFFLSHLRRLGGTHAHCAKIAPGDLRPLLTAAASSS